MFWTIGSIRACSEQLDQAQLVSSHTIFSAMPIFQRVATIFFGPEPSSPIYNGSPNWATFLGFNPMLPEVPVLELIGLFIGYPHTHDESQMSMELNYFRFAGLPLNMKPIRVYQGFSSLDFHIYIYIYIYIKATSISLSSVSIIMSTPTIRLHI